MFQGRLGPPPAEGARAPEHTHIGEKFKRQFGAVFTNPKDKGQTTTSDVHGSSIQSSSRLLACVYNIIFASSFWGSDRQTDRRTGINCLRAWWAAENSSASHLLVLHFSLGLLGFVIVAYAWQARACRLRLGHVIFGLRRLFSCFFLAVFGQAQIHPHKASRNSPQHKVCLTFFATVNAPIYLACLRLWRPTSSHCLLAVSIVVGFAIVALVVVVVVCHDL